MHGHINVKFDVSLSKAVSIGVWAGIVLTFGVVTFWKAAAGRTENVKETSVSLDRLIAGTYSES